MCCLVKVFYVDVFFMCKSEIKLLFFFWNIVMKIKFIVGVLDIFYGVN